MAHIVFTSVRFRPECTANTNCIEKLIEELLKRGHHVSVIAGTSYSPGEEIICGAKVIKIKNRTISDMLLKANNPVKKLLVRIWHAIHSVLAIPFFPNTELVFTGKMADKLIELNRVDKIDCVIGTYRSFPCIAAAIKLKKTDPTVKCVLYYLDLLKGLPKPYGRFLKYYHRLCDAGELKAFKEADKLLIARGGKNFYASPYFDEIRNKIEYIEFPVLKVAEKAPAPAKKEKPVFCYAGFTDASSRNPLGIIEIISKMNDTYAASAEFHLYGKAFLAEELMELSKREPFFTYHGVVSKETADSAADSADYLISIGNDAIGLVPSKIFELFSTRKPIVHIKNGPNDLAAEYMEKYPEALILSRDSSTEENSRLLYEFICREHKPVSVEYIKKTFSKATPDSAVNEIEKLL